MKKEMIAFYTILIFIGMAGVVNAIECGSVPTNGCTVTNNTNFIEGVYNFSSGITIKAHDIILDCNGATLIGTGSGNGIYNEKYDNVTIKNCNVKNYINGIRVASSYKYSSSISVDNIIYNNVLEENENGIVVSGYYRAYQTPGIGSGHKVSNNILRDNSNKGISLSRVENSIVLDNSVENSDYGIHVDNADNLNISENSVENSDYGAYLASSDNNNIYDNSFINNINQGLYMNSGCWDNLVYDNIFNQTGIDYDSTGRNKYCLSGQFPNEYNEGSAGPSCSCLPLLDGLIINSDEDICTNIYNFSSGITIKAHDIILDCNGATLIGTGSGNGIYNERFDNIEIKNCNVKNYSVGIVIGAPLGSDQYYIPYNNTVSNNVLEGNIRGVSVSGYYRAYQTPSLASEHNVSNNILRNNSDKAISISWTENSIVSDNIVEDSDYGIYVNNADNLNISDNIVENSNYGAYLASSDDNNIYENSFINNSIQAYNTGSNNWNNSNYGNYWDDYDTEEEGCYDSNGDSICDTPYNTSGSGGIDYLPFFGVRILEIIPIQVVRDVDLVLGKTTLVRAVLENPMREDKDVNVSLYFDGVLQENREITINDRQQVNEDFWFVPESAGLSKEIKIEMEEIE